MGTSRGTCRPQRYAAASPTWRPEYNTIPVCLYPRLPPNPKHHFCALPLTSPNAPLVVLTDRSIAACKKLLHKISDSLKKELENFITLILAGIVGVGYDTLGWRSIGDGTYHIDARARMHFPLMTEMPDKTPSATEAFRTEAATYIGFAFLLQKCYVKIHDFWICNVLVLYHCSLCSQYLFTYTYLYQ